MNSKLKNLRENKGLTQIEIAQIANITERQYRRIEKGEQEPKVTTAILIAKALKTTTEKLFPITDATDTGKSCN